MKNSNNQLENINIKSFTNLISPDELNNLYPISDKAKQTVLKARGQIQDILNGKDKRLMVICGPCSIHDLKAAKQYAQKLKKTADDLADQLLIIMRVYFEKPRTTVGWKGLINDPHLDDSFDIEQGLKLARKFLIDINELGLACASEALDPVSPQYLDDLFAWMAIGARTAESQTHREMASGLSMPIGFKNGTDGNIMVAINGINSAKNAHSFLGIDHKGNIAVIKTLGNRYGHIILRGGKEPNYAQEFIEKTEKLLEENKILKKIVVDCSHANSYKNYKLQPLVALDIIEQILAGNQSICALMLESHLFEGNQVISSNKADLKYGVSITDACLGWSNTQKLLYKIGKKLAKIN